MALQGRKLMQPKKKFAVKLKTLTITLALATGINITNGFADEATDAEKVTAFGAGLKDFIKDYDNANSPAVKGVVAKTSAAATGVGTYKAVGKVGTDDSKAITKGKDLTKTRYVELLADAKAIDLGVTKVQGVFGNITGTKKKAEILKNLLTNLGDANPGQGLIEYVDGVATLGNASTPAGVDNALKKLVNNSATGENISTAAKTDALVTNIHNLNIVIE
ncbi:Hypothetical predicted protein, partial [Paramuricea clavata]